jgi:2'-5' RNA ligase
MRLFVAVNLPDHLRRDLDTRLDTVRRRVRLAWTRPATWHLTLMFLGDWPADRASALPAALDDAVSGLAPVPVRTGAVGAFPDLRRPRVLFLHMDGGDPLGELAARVRRAVNATWPDGPQDHRNFRAHLTLARIKAPLSPADRRELEGLDPGVPDPFPATCVELMASDLRPDGARYRVLHRALLGG